jgi:hypothetical protein
MNRELNRGLQPRVQLLKVYLDEAKQRRELLDRAEEFVKKEAKSEIVLYRFFGEMGVAIVMAHREQATESYRQFQKALDALPPLFRRDRIRSLLGEPVFEGMVNEAIHLNEKKQPVPADLRRTLERPRRPPPGTDAKEGIKD